MKKGMKHMSRDGQSSVAPKGGFHNSPIAGGRNRVVTDHPHTNRRSMGSKGSNPATVDTPDWK